jgi:hypothetical protein
MIRNRLLKIGLLLTVMLCLGSCSTASYRGSIGVGAGYYPGGGWYDPYHYRPCCGTVMPPPGYGRPPGFRPPMGGGRPANLPSQPRPSLRR